MKYVFVLVLLMLGGVAGVLGLNVGYRWFHNMTESPRIMPGERLQHVARERAARRRVAPAQGRA